MTSAYGIEAGQAGGGAPKVGGSNPPGSLLQGGGATKVLRLQLCLASALCDQCALPSSAPFVGGLRFLVETSATALRGTIHEYECVQVSFAFFASISSMLLISNAVIAQRVVAVWMIENGIFFFVRKLCF